MFRWSRFPKVDLLTKPLFFGRAGILASRMVSKRDLGQTIPQTVCDTSERTPPKYREHWKLSNFIFGSERFQKGD